MTQESSRLSLIVFSGDFTRVHYALVIASAAAATNRPVTLFFTMGAVRCLLAENNEGAEPGAPGWHGLTGENNKTAAQIDRGYGEKGVARFEELFSACIELGVRFMVCEMGLRAAGFEGAALRADVDAAKGGVVSFLSDSGDRGRLLFI